MYKEFLPRFQARYSFYLEESLTKISRRFENTEKEGTNEMISLQLEPFDSIKNPKRLRSRMQRSRFSRNLDLPASIEQ